jgi:hypothetical protein
MGKPKVIQNDNVAGIVFSSAVIKNETRESNSMCNFEVIVKNWWILKLI